MVMNTSKAPENTGSNYIVFSSVLATGAGFVDSRCYRKFFAVFKTVTCPFSLGMV